MGLEREIDVAIRAVKQAAAVCRSVQANLVTARAVEKQDKSPVTIADFASQAVVCRALHEVFPGDPIVGEEDAGALRQSASLRAEVATHVQAALGRDVSESAVLDAIDLGSYTPDGNGRFWTVDPIDGTKGFLRGEQYAVALALIEAGQVVLGVLGCPNLMLSSMAQPGVLLVAARGQGTRMMSLTDETAAPVSIRVSALAEPSQARFCESVESGHSDQSSSARIAERLGITAEPYRIDSQCKYAVVARGDASIYLRLPTRADYREKIWDHAAGCLVVEEAGGKVTDATGKPLDFSRGRQLEDNRGVIATCGTIHAAVVEAVGRVIAS